MGYQEKTYPYEQCTSCGKKHYCDGFCDGCGQKCYTYSFCPTCKTKATFDPQGNLYCQSCGSKLNYIGQCDKCGQIRTYDVYCDKFCYEYSNKCVENLCPNCTQMKCEEVLGRSFPFSVACTTGTCPNAQPAKPKLALKPCGDL